MATSAFKSATKKVPIGTTPKSDEYSSSEKGIHRRSRSLSSFSRSVPRLENDAHAPLPRGSFVNTIRSLGFPEISLDDLTLQLSPLKDLPVGEKESDCGVRLSRRRSEVGRWATHTASSSQRRGRSVSRQKSVAGDGKGSKVLDAAGGRVGPVADSNFRRRRSMSVVRHQPSDSESHSSALTDDKERDGCSSKKGIEKIIRAVYTQKTDHRNKDNLNDGLYDVFRNELRHAVEEIKTEFKHATVRKTSALATVGSLLADNCDVVEAFLEFKKNDSTKLEQKSNDRNAVTRRLTEEAEKYFKDFIYNVTDTDISSFDEERSDTCSSLGGNIKQTDGMCYGDAATSQNQASSFSHPIQMDGIILPWLQWETSNDGPPISGKNKAENPNTSLCYPVKDATFFPDASDHSNISSALLDGPDIVDHGNKCKECGSCQKSNFDMDEYISLQSKEYLLHDLWAERNRISSGGLLLCGNLFNYHSFYSSSR